jgi:methionyl-tRNA formyltransferase
MERSLIIGEGTLPVHCANVLLKHGHVVCAVSSPDAPLQQWAAERDVHHFPTLADFTAFARAEPFDYLFSIVNYRILPGSLLSLPKRLAINYHDSLLPRYAGVRATSWALLNGETTHGVTWHLMAEGIDTGDILKQASVPIGTQDTAYKLNLKCYYTAIAAFSELVGELKSGAVTRTRQDLSLRTYFGLSKRPDNNCLISFNWPAAQIDAFCRALDFESTPNPLGMPKVVIGGRLLVAARTEKTGVVSKDIPGTVRQIVGEGIQVATSTEDIILTSIQTVGGRALPMGELRQYGIAPGINIEAPVLSPVSCPE